MQRIEGKVQHYAWGDPSALPELLGLPPDGRPWAELWLGTHPNGPSRTEDGQPLVDVAGPLPYLLKVLAAGEALSLQTHPSAEQAASGFAREEQHGPALGHPARIYQDPSAKPELICALTPFDALCGFRPVDATIALLGRIGAHELADELADHGLAPTVRGLYHGHVPIDAAIAACAGRPEAEARLVSELAQHYPDDPSVAVTLLLHRVTLAPGEAIFLGPGNLHAYLRGVGVEIMGASDNVVRGGLTVKHVDVDELLTVLDISPLDDPIVRPIAHGDGWARYDTPDTPFRLWRLVLDGDRTETSTGRELWLCTDGDAGALRRGQSAYLAPGASIHLSGTATIFRVEAR